LSAIKREIVCIVCTRGCRAVVWEGSDGTIKVEGSLCRNGQNYVRFEFRDPRRTITTTIRVEGTSGRLPVRTNGPVPKSLIMDCMQKVGEITATKPVHMGDVVISNLLGTGQDLIAAGEIGI
jgi:CxxC motif-containing protein